MSDHKYYAVEIYGDALHDANPNTKERQYAMRMTVGNIPAEVIEKLYHHLRDAAAAWLKAEGIVDPDCVAILVPPQGEENHGPTH